MGVKHQTKFKVGDRINDCFTLIKDICKPTTIPGKNQ